MLITFETNSAELTPRARQSLDVVGRALASNQLAEFKFQIEGHADPRGGNELNDRLSQARAESVRQYLTQQHGIAEQRLARSAKARASSSTPRIRLRPKTAGSRSSTYRTELSRRSLDVGLPADLFDREHRRAERLGTIDDCWCALRAAREERRLTGVRRVTRLRFFERKFGERLDVAQAR